jgi:hypothetical protein
MEIRGQLPAHASLTTMGKEGCGRSTLAVFLRTCNAVNAGIGAALVGYGSYLAVKFTSSPLMYGVCIGLGFVNFLLSSIILCCGHKSLFFLRLYAMVLGLLELVQIVIVVLLMVPSTQNKIVDAANLPDDLKTLLLNNINLVGYVLIGVVAFQGMVLVLVFSQMAVVDKGFDSDDEEDVSTALLSRNNTATASKASKIGKKGDRFSALADEGLEEAKPARNLYREKNKTMYEKYSRS